VLKVTLKQLTIVACVGSDDVGVPEEDLTGVIMGLLCGFR